MRISWFAPFQQLQQLIRPHREDGTIGGAGHGVGQRLLGLLQFHDFFFNGILCNELIHLHRVLLADAVGAVGGLILGGDVPPRVVVDDDVRRRQVESGAAGPQ